MVCIALAIFALNELQVKCGDILNAYITALVMDLIWTTLGPDFDDYQDNMAIIFCGLYGLKSSGSAFSKHLGGLCLVLVTNLVLLIPTFRFFGK